MIDKYTKYEYYLVIMGYNPNEIEKIIQNLTVPSD